MKIGNRLTVKFLNVEYLYSDMVCKVLTSDVHLSTLTRLYYKISQLETRLITVYKVL